MSLKMNDKETKKCKIRFLLKLFLFNLFIESRCMRVTVKRVTVYPKRRQISFKKHSLDHQNIERGFFIVTALIRKKIHYSKWKS